MSIFYIKYRERCSWFRLKWVSLGNRRSSWVSPVQRERRHELMQVGGQFMCSRGQCCDYRIPTRRAHYTDRDVRGPRQHLHVASVWSSSTAPILIWWTGTRNCRIRLEPGPISRIRLIEERANNWSFIVLCSETTARFFINVALKLLI